MIRVKEEEPQAGVRTLIVSPAEEKSGIAVRLEYGVSANFPSRIRVEGIPQNVQVEVESWQIDAPVSAQVFDPPADKPRKVVSREDLYRMYGAVVNFLAEMAP